jgi:hypothetical protein
MDTESLVDGKVTGDAAAFAVLRFAGKLRLVRHGPDYERGEQALRQVEIRSWPERPAVHIRWWEPRCQNSQSWHVDDGRHFYTLEDWDGTVLYDTRLVVPCDTAAWQPPSRQKLDLQLRLLLGQARAAHKRREKAEAAAR